MQRDESEERFIHRLEAFSDIVIGFSLAQLGVSLTIPAHGYELIQHPAWFGSFVFAFAVVCSMWFFHHRLFARFFVPRFWPVVLNFVWLALIVLLVFTAEMYVHLPDDVVVMRLYFACYALAYLILGFQSVLGVRYLGAALDAETRRWGHRNAAFMFLWAMPFLWCLIVAVVLPPSPLLGILIMVAFILAGTGSGFMSSHFRRSDNRLQTSS